MKAISLFSGMGGDTLGLENAGIDVIAYSEKEKIFQKTHEANFPHSKLIGDGNILQTSDDEFLKYKGKIDLIFAGFPCQGFSQAGKKLPDDPRNTLFREFVRATKLINPDYIIGENVTGFISKKTESGELFIDVIKNEFELLGYTIYHEIMDCSYYGIPQNRKRVIIFGIKSDLNQTYSFPEKNKQNKNLKDIINFSMVGSIKINKEDFDMNNIPVECIIKNMDNNECEQNPHSNLKLLAKDKGYEYKGDIYSRRIHFGKRILVGGEIIDIRKPINTIISSYGRCPRFFVPLQNKNGYYLRCLLPSELKQIQGFPKNYNICGNITKQIEQIGNAVPPPLIEQIILSLINA